MNEPRLTLATASAWREEVLGQFPDDRIELDKIDVLSGDSVPGIYN